MIKVGDYSPWPPIGASSPWPREQISPLPPTRTFHWHTCEDCSVTWAHERPAIGVSEADYVRAHTCPRCKADIRLHSKECLCRNCTAVRNGDTAAIIEGLMNRILDRFGL